MSLRFPPLLVCLPLLLTMATSAQAAWSPPEVINTPQTGFTPLVIDSGGIVHVVYSTLDNQTIHWKARLPNGSGGFVWTDMWAGVPVQTNTWFPDIAVDAQRNIYIIWNRVRAADSSMVKFNYTGNNTWAPAGQPVDVPGLIGYWPMIRVGPKGYMHCTCYHQDAAGDRQVYYTINPTANWSVPSAWTAISQYDGSSDLQGVSHENLQIDSNDDAHIVYPWGPPGTPGDVHYIKLHYANNAVTTSIGPLNIPGDPTPDNARSYWQNVCVDRLTNTAYIAIQQNDNYLNQGTHTWLWSVTSAGAKSGPFNVSPYQAQGIGGPELASRNGRLDIASTGYDACSGQLSPFVFTYGSGVVEEPLTCKRLTNQRFNKDNAGNDYLVCDNTTDDNTLFFFRNNNMSLGTITGKITDASSHAAISGALVTVAGAYNFAATTDASGNYTISSVYGGSYTVKASKVNYQDNTSAVTVTNGVTSTVNIALTAGQDTTPPSNPSSFAAQQKYTGDIVLSWTNAPEADLVGTMIRMSTTAFPANSTAGTLVTNITGPPSAAGTFTVTGLTAGLTYYFSAFSYDHTPNYSSGAHVQAQSLDPTIGQARQLPDNTAVVLHNKVVTSLQSTDGYLYVEQPDRSAGIRLVAAPAGIIVGDRVNVSGTVTTRSVSSTASERQMSSPVITKVTPIPAPPALAAIAMTCRSVGGAPLGLAPGVVNGHGLNNIGDLVRIAGKVTFKTAGTLYVDDGTGVQDTSGRIGVLVQVPTGYSTASIVAGTTMVSVTGIVEGSVPVGFATNRRFLRPRTAGDISIN